MHAAHIRDKMTTFPFSKNNTRTHFSKFRFVHVTLFNVYSQWAVGVNKVDYMLDVMASDEITKRLVLREILKRLI